MRELFDRLYKHKLIILIILDCIIFVFSLSFSNFLRINTLNIYELNYLIFGGSAYLIFFTLSSVFKFYQIRFTFFNYGTIKIILRIYILYIFLLSIIFFNLKLEGFPRSLAIIFPSAFMFFQICARIIILDFFLSPGSKKTKTNSIFIGYNDYINRKNIIDSSSQFRISAVVRNKSKNSLLHEYLDNKVVLNFDELKNPKNIKNYEYILIGDTNLKIKDKIFLQSLNKKIYYLQSTFEIKKNKSKKVIFNEYSQFENFLNRNEKEFDNKDWKNFFYKKTIYVTGAGGTIGSAISKKILNSNFKKLILIDFSEYNLWKLTQEIEETLEIKKKKKEIILNKIYYKLVDINNEVQMKNLFSKFEPQVIYHAASYKHVNLVQSNLHSAVFNNINSFLLLCNLARKHKTNYLTLISSDKAVNPHNLMGHTKRIQEKILLSMQKTKERKQKYSIVRFGNVLGSSGSLLEILERRFKKELKFNLYHNNLTRYFMTQNECASLVIDTSIKCDNETNKIYILDMGKRFKVLEIVKNFLQFSNINTKRKKELDKYIRVTYLKKFEKMHEELNYKKLKVSNFNKGIYYEEDETNYSGYIGKVKTILSNSAKLSEKEIISKIEDISF